MKYLGRLLVVIGLVGMFGCSGDDPNKNLKPLDPNSTPRPKVGQENQGGGGGGDRPVPVIR